MKKVITSIEFSTDKNCFLVETSEDNYLIAYEDYERLQLYVGMEISQTLMYELEKNRRLNMAKSVAIKYLSYRPRATREIRDRLRKDHFEEAIIEETVAHLLEQDMIDDAEFARIFYDDKIRLNHWSTRKINFELSRKGISGNIIDKLTEEYQIYDFENALSLVESKIGIWKEKYDDPYRLKNKIYSYLSSRGHDYNTIQMILEEIL